MQLNLFGSENKRQLLIHDVNPNDCIISRFNTRKTRLQEDVEKLAERIGQNGFELTRAPWAYRNDKDVLEIFAGGTRLEAAILADVKVPIVLFEGYSNEEIARLTDQDNENDEYHAPVPSVDTWAEYARLRDEEGWTQQQIADAKGLKSRVMVSYRLRLHSLPQSIKNFVNQGLLTETHLIEITSLSIDLHFAPWLTTEQAWGELAEWAARGYTVRQTKEKVGHWKSLVKLANKTYSDFSEKATLYDFGGDKPQPHTYNERQAFLDELVERKSRTQTSVKEAQGAVEILVSKNLKEYQIWVNEKTEEAARRAVRAEREKDILSKFQQNDCLDENAVNQLQDKSVRLLLIDPPYGKNFQSNRRVKSPKAPKLVGDMDGEAIELYQNMLKTYRPKLQKDVHILSFCDWRSEPKFRSALKDAGFTLRGSLIWVKENHSSGDLVGSFAPKHERILHATLGRPLVEPRIDDVFIFPRDLDSNHPTAKPIPLLEKLILSCTAEGDLVIDPMAGCGPVLLAAWNLNRNFWGCEIDKQWHDEGCEKLMDKLTRELDNDIW